MRYHVIKLTKLRISHKETHKKQNEEQTQACHDMIRHVDAEKCIQFNPLNMADHSTRTPEYSFDFGRSFGKFVTETNEYISLPKLNRIRFLSKLD